MSLLKRKRKKPSQVFDHHDCILLLRAAKISYRKGKIEDIEKFFARVKGTLSDPKVTQQQAYNKLKKLKDQHEDWVREGTQHFEDPYRQELLDEYRKVWGTGYSKIRMDVYSQELLKRSYWELGWKYQQPADQLTTNQTADGNLKKQPGDIYTHGDCILIVKAVQIYNHKGQLKTNKANCLRSLQGRLSDPRIKSKQINDKLKKIKDRYNAWISKDKHQFKNPCDQELHDECELAWGIEANLSGFAMEFISQEFLKRNYQKLGWSYQKPQ